MVNTRIGYLRRCRKEHELSALGDHQHGTNFVDGSQEQQKNILPPETRRPWLGHLRAGGQQQSSTHASSTVNNSSVSSGTTTLQPESKLTKTCNNPNAEDIESEEQDQAPDDTHAVVTPAVDENDNASREGTKSVPNEDAAENVAKAKGLRSALKKTFNPRYPVTVIEGMNFCVGEIPDEFEADAHELLKRMDRCFRQQRQDPESKEFVVALLHAAAYSAECGVKSSLDFDISEEALSAEFAACRKQKIKDTNEAVAKLSGISEEKENRKCRFVEETEVNIYTPHDFEEKDRALRKFDAFLDSKIAGKLSKTMLESKHKGLIPAEHQLTYLNMAENRINPKKPGAPILSVASVHLREISSEVDTPAVIQGPSNIQPTATALSSSEGRRCLVQGPSLADSSKIHEIIGGEKRKRKSQQEEEEWEEEEEILEMPSKRPRLREKIDDADQSRVAEKGINNTQTPAREAEEVEKASPSTGPAKENTPLHPSDARVVEQSPELPARRLRVPMRECTTAIQTRQPQVEVPEPKLRRSARGRIPNRKYCIN